MVGFLFSIILSQASASPFRVLVYPHQGTFPTPQGRESTVSEVTITSNQVCNEYAATLNAKHEWAKSGDLIQSSKSITLSANSFPATTTPDATGTLFFECTSPFKVNRVSPLLSYSYEGNFVAILDSDDKSGPIQIVDLIEPEKYIQGVVPAEVGNNWPEEALKAQAVAARTFAWWTVLNTRTSSQSTFYDLDDTVQFQAYLGTSNHTVATDGAVAGTAGQVMKYEGKVIKAYFSADSGGKTESSANAFGESLPYCVSKVELYDLSKTKTSWVTTIPLATIGTALAQPLKSIEVLATDLDNSGRVSQVTITTTGDKIIKVSGPVFRRALKLRSTLFQLSTITVNAVESAQITGKGFGHGVGMAQVGAKEYATQLGWTFDQIVKFYYTGITLEPVTNEYFE
jgi:SpoIID/LytB domain protein